MPGIQDVSCFRVDARLFSRLGVPACVDTRLHQSITLRLHSPVDTRLHSWSITGPSVWGFTEAMLQFGVFRRGYD